MVIELNSETLKLHPIIYFDEEENTCSYNSFSEKGARKLTNGQLVVKANESKRFIFEKYKDSGFREYGEELIEGKWIRYFEDIFTNAK